MYFPFNIRCQHLFLPFPLSLRTSCSSAAGAFVTCSYSCTFWTPGFNVNLLVAYLISQNLLKLVSSKRWQKDDTACVWYYTCNKQFQQFLLNVAEGICYSSCTSEMGVCCYLHCVGWAVLPHTQHWQTEGGVIASFLSLTVSVLCGFILRQEFKSQCNCTAK